jgi:deaminated glutathione amidase
LVFTEIRWRAHAGHGIIAMMPSRRIVAAVVQLCSRQQVAENLDTCARLIADAARRGAQLVVLPENFAYIGQLQHKLTLAEPLDADAPGPILSFMIARAREHRLHLLLGGVPIRSADPHRFHNTAILLDDEGRIRASYRKIHLFDIDIPGTTFTESACVLPGDVVVTTEALGATLGLSICYDLRFPELYRALAAQGATVIAVPAAFTLHTGKDHWHALLRARAIENQCFVLAADQHGAHTDRRSSFGKSCVIDPWGAIVAQVSDGEGVAVAELDLDQLARVRRELPALTHRRLP